MWKYVALFGGFLFSYFTFRFSHIVSTLQEKRILMSWDVYALYPGAGGLLAFYIDIRGLSAVSVPEGYNQKNVEEILARYEPKKPVTMKELKKLRRPHIITILSESFADLSIHGKFETNQDYMPFVRGLKNNTARGFVSVTAFGGHTCNSEYEYLTGNSMGFYPPSYAAYLGMVNSRQESLTYILNDYGYHTVGCSAASSEIWAMGKNYKLLEFKDTFFLESDFYNKTATHNKRPLDSIVIKGMIDNIYNKRPKDKPLFLFLTTMQNHGSYGKIKNATVFARDYQDVYQLSTFLTGIKMTDDCVKKLIEYFSKEKEDVVLVFYGDHQPHIPEFTEKLVGGAKQDLPVEKRALFQFTPYFVWANYPIKSKRENIALSYLSSKVMEIAGLPKTAYMNFLDDTKKMVPMMTNFAYLGPDHVWYWRDNKTESSAYLDRYWKVQQYMINDRTRKKYAIED